MKTLIIYRRFKKLVRQKTTYDYTVTGKMSCCQLQCLATLFTDVEKEFLKIAEKNPGLVFHVWSEFFMIRGTCDSYYYYDGKLQEKQMHGQENSESENSQSIEA